MKQATNKLFRGCPYENVNFGCAECINYPRCMKKKKQKRMERRAQKVQCFFKITLPTILLIATLITTIATIVMCVTIRKHLDSSNDATLPTVQTTAEPSLVIVNLGEESVEELSKEEYKNSDDACEMEDDLKEGTVGEDFVLEDQISANGPSDSLHYILSEEDMLLIAKLVWAESRGEPFEGKVAVAAVVLNRYYYGNDGDFNRDSIETIITQRTQFASIKNVSLDDLKEVPECTEAVNAACKGWDPTREVFPEGALYFFAHDKVSGYQKEIREGVKVMVIGNHSFHYDFEKVS